VLAARFNLLLANLGKKKKEDSHWGLLARWREIDARSSSSFFLLIDA
jgi:hypothetical protein